MCARGSDGSRELDNKTFADLDVYAGFRKIIGAPADGTGLRELHAPVDDGQPEPVKYGPHPKPDWLAHLKQCVNTATD